MEANAYPETERSYAADEVARTIGNRRYSRRPCPQCTRLTLIRVPLPRRLRLLRRIGIDLRRYTCASCASTVILRR
jgi:ribosomal protein L37AE/L43A